uniref:Uncharacterized protein n=1 Tax=Branchiostoma floridae TaxID=7739 RepID=C3Z6Z2_BRAFL|eukprot:XP_002595576.1 hypothetical protein BRAFLDRAFT_64655 [Branchiostoma floridae]
MHHARPPDTAMMRFCFCSGGQEDRLVMSGWKSCYYDFDIVLRQYDFTCDFTTASFVGRLNRGDMAFKACQSGYTDAVPLITSRADGGTGSGPVISEPCLRALCAPRGTPYQIGITG